MKAWIGILLLALMPAFAAEKSDIMQRVSIAESIFDEKFTARNFERMLGRNIDGELLRLEKKEAAKEYVLKIRKLFSDIARDIVGSKSFRGQYVSWIAGEMSKAELQSYLDFLRSDIGRRISDLDDRAQPLLAEAIARGTQGRYESINLFLAEARAK